MSFRPSRAPRSRRAAGAGMPRPVLERPASRGFSSPRGRARSSGLGGLDGQGQRELLLALFGVLRGADGRGAGRWQAGAIDEPAARATIRHRRMALIPEDRKTEGLMLPMTVRENLSFAALDRVSRKADHRSRSARQSADRRDGQAAGDQGRRRSTFPSARCRAATSRKW